MSMKPGFKPFRVATIHLSTFNLHNLRAFFFQMSLLYFEKILNLHFKDEAQTALFKDPVRTAQ